MPQYNYDKSKPLLVDKPYYKLNFLFENDYRVFYDLKTSILGENIATIEIFLACWTRFIKDKFDYY